MPKNSHSDPDDTMNSNLSVLPAHLQARVKSELRPGEAVAWIGQPNPTRFMRSGFFLWLFFIPWTAFSLFWIAGASGFKFPDFSHAWSWFPLFGLPFLLIGLGGLSSPLWLYRKAANIVYIVTNQRAFSLEGARSYTVRTYLPAQLTHIVRKEHPDGSGDLLLEVLHYKDSDGDSRKKENGFFAIADVRKVEQLLERLMSFQKSE